MEQKSVHRHLQIKSNFEYEKDSFRNPLRKNIYHKSFNLRIIKGYKKEEKFGSKSRVKWLKEETRIQCLSVGHVTPQFWPHGIKNLHDVYIVFKSWWGAQDQGPSIDLVLFVSTIKVDGDGYSAKSGT